MHTLKQTLRNGRLHGLLLIALVLNGCSDTPSPRADRDGYPDRPPADVLSVPDAVPRVEPYSRYGNPSEYAVFGRRYRVASSSVGYVERGTASWYGTKFHGRRTSSGEPYDMYAMTAAHKTLPLPTYARVTNLRNGRSVVVKINDRGPFAHNRIIDLSYTAAAKLGILSDGTGQVEVRALDPRRPQDRLAGPATTRPTAASPVGDAAAVYLQLGAFQRRDNAEQLRSKLQDAPLPGLHISEGLSNQRPVYRVRVGPLAGLDAADRLVETLGRYGITDPRIVTD
ncbi:MAG: septal ring lytic transglycosylase RlpA family protein [Gammaproteobacteria bacterium]